MTDRAVPSSVPIPPVDANVHTIACEYCPVACGYKVYTWPIGSEGGLTAGENALGIDYPVSLLTGKWPSETMHNVVLVGGEPHHVIVIPDGDSEVVNVDGNHSVRGGASRCLSVLRGNRKGGTMKRSEFEHAIRAAGSILGTDELMIIGSQAIHATISEELPEAAQRSIEVDVVALDDPEGRKADLIDGSIGEASMFHATFGYYAQGVSESTAVLPERWRDRLIRFETPATNSVVAWCLEVHDLWVSKAIANREKDIEFCRALQSSGVVDKPTLRSRLEAVSSLAPALRQLVERRIEEH